MDSPLISVIMGIYNCEKTLKEAIESIFAQTYCNWELIMCDDGSTDSTFLIAEEYQKKNPERIELIRHTKNCGLNQTLNDCLKSARGDYIARMDGDDISLPTRFEEEMKAFTDEPQLAVVSCPMIYFDSSGEWGRGSSKGNEYPEKKRLAKGVVHCHAAAIIKRSVFEEVNGYTVDRKLLRVEDWHLWVKIYALGYQGKNIDECLYAMRDDHDALKRKKFGTAFNEFYVSTYAIKQLGLSPVYYIYSIRPFLVGVMPRFIYKKLHHWKMNRRKES